MPIVQLSFVRDYGKQVVCVETIWETRRSQDPPESENEGSTYGRMSSFEGNRTGSLDLVRCCVMSKALSNRQL